MDPIESATTSKRARIDEDEKPEVDEIEEGERVSISDDDTVIDVSDDESVIEADAPEEAEPDRDMDPYNQYIDEAQRLELEEDDIEPEPQYGANAFDRRFQAIEFGARGRKQQGFLRYFLQRLQPRLEQMMTDEVKKSAVKFLLVLKMDYQHPAENHTTFAALNTGYKIALTRHDVPETVQKLYDKAISMNANYCRERTGMTISKIRGVDVHTARYTPLKGGCFAELPVFLARKGAIVNVHNTDMRCFGYAVAAALHPLHNRRHQSEAIRYNRYFNEHHLNEIEYPVAPDQTLREIEQTIQVNLNVYSYGDDKGKLRYPIYVGRQNYPQSVDLLYANEHWFAIRNFSRFMGDKNGNEHHRFYCRRCLGRFTQQAMLDKHSPYCQHDDFDTESIITMPLPGEKLEFHDYPATEFAPFVAYADFESLTEPIDVQIKHTHRYQKHTPCSYGLKIVSRCMLIRSFDYETYTGLDCVAHFLNRLKELAEICAGTWDMRTEMSMTWRDWDKYRAQTICKACNKPFEDGEIRVRDHCHVTGRFRAALHQVCNLRVRQTKHLHVFIHNFRGYDSHLILRGFRDHPEMELSIVAQSMEKYLAVRWGKDISFKDSFQFMTSSLARLVESMPADKYKNVKEEFHLDVHIANNNFMLYYATRDLLLEKGVYPYDYMSNMARFNEDHLPARAAFDNGLRDEPCSVADYERAVKVWRVFGCRTMLDYHNVYLKADVLQLADLFEEFRSQFYEQYNLDPAMFITTPQMSWAAMLRFCTVDRPLNTDPEIYRRMMTGVRGGIAQITTRYAKANNPEMGGLWVPEDPISYIVYLDANNLYGWALSQRVPSGVAEWVDRVNYEQINWQTIDEEAEFGYILDCDLEYPVELHDAHNDYPLAPQRLTIGLQMLSRKQRQLRIQLGISGNGESSKLCPNLMNKEHYIVHYRNLKFYLQHGLIMTRVHAVLRFPQSAWLKPYIDKNSEMRKAARSDFAKDLFKLLNNAVYGKTMQNESKYTDIKLVTDEQKAARLSEMPHCKQVRIFEERLVGIELKKSERKISKPFDVGFTVLELSKLLMYQFHYDYIKAKYGARAKLLFTDTDSLMYHIETNDVYADMRADKHKFDFSDYPDTHPNHDVTNCKKIGVFKDETNGQPIVEFVGLMAKMYSYTVARMDEVENVMVADKHRAKGIQFQASKRISHADYVRMLREPHQQTVSNRRINSKNHKYALSCSIPFGFRLEIVFTNVFTFAIGCTRSKSKSAASPRSTTSGTCSTTASIRWRSVTATSRLPSSWSVTSQSSPTCPSSPTSTSWRAWRSTERCRRPRARPRRRRWSRCRSTRSTTCCSLRAIWSEKCRRCRTLRLTTSE